MNQEKVKFKKRKETMDYLLIETNKRSREI